MEDGLQNAWIFFLDPDGKDDIVFRLATGQLCDSGGICTGDGTTLSAAPEPRVLPGPEQQNNPSTGLPSISGTPQVEQTLTADTSEIDDQDGLTNVSYGYQWIAGGADIDGATGASYTLTASEQGKTIQVRVTFADDRENAESLTSIATAAVAAASRCRSLRPSATCRPATAAAASSPLTSRSARTSRSATEPCATTRSPRTTTARSPERSGRCRAAARPGRSPSNPAATAQSPSRCPRPRTARPTGPSAPATDGSCRTQPRSQSQARSKPVRLQEPPVRVRTGTGRTGANISSDQTNDGAGGSGRWTLHRPLAFWPAHMTPWPKK